MLVVLEDVVNEEEERLLLGRFNDGRCLVAVAAADADARCCWRSFCCFKVAAKRRWRSNTSSALLFGFGILLFLWQSWTEE